MSARQLPEELIGPRPGCFSLPQWAVWVAAETEAPEPDPNGFCSACTPAYAAEMRAAGQCEYPATTFAIEGDGDDANDIVGVREHEDRIPATRLCTREAAKALRESLADLIERVRPAPDSSIRGQLIAARNAGLGPAVI